MYAQFEGDKWINCKWILRIFKNVSCSIYCCFETKELKGKS